MCKHPILKAQILAWIGFNHAAGALLRIAIEKRLKLLFPSLRPQKAVARMRGLGMLSLTETRKVYDSLEWCNKAAHGASLKTKLIERRTNAFWAAKHLQNRRPA